MRDALFNIGLDDAFAPVNLITFAEEIGAAILPRDVAWKDPDFGVALVMPWCTFAPLRIALDTDWASRLGAAEDRSSSWASVGRYPIWVRSS